MLYMDFTSNYLPQGCMAWGVRALKMRCFSVSGFSHAIKRVVTYLVLTTGLASLPV
jgi:hypothetical protein